MYVSEWARGNAVQLVSLFALFGKLDAISDGTERSTPVSDFVCNIET